MLTVNSAGSHTAENNGLRHTRVSARLPEQLTAVGVIFVIDCFLQDAAEMKWQPAESENQHQAEDRLGYFPPLRTHTHTQTSVGAAEVAVKGRGSLNRAFVPASCGR